MDPMEQARQVFALQKYVAIHNFLPGEVLTIFSMYPTFQERRFGRHIDDQVPADAHSTYADPLTECLLVMIQPLVEEVVGKKMLPAYSYYRNYRAGAELTPHTDRPSCEYTVSICLAFSYDDESYRWPLTVGEQDITMNPGDLVIYKGAELNHARVPFPGSERAVHSQAFLHYIAADGEYTDEKYDKRPALGFPALSRNADAPEWAVS